MQRLGGLRKKAVINVIMNLHVHLNLCATKTLQVQKYTTYDIRSVHDYQVPGSFFISA